MDVQVRNYIPRKTVRGDFLSVSQSQIYHVCKRDPRYQNSIFPCESRCVTIRKTSPEYAIPLFITVVMSLIFNFDSTGINGTVGSRESTINLVTNTAYSPCLAQEGVVLLLWIDCLTDIRYVIRDYCINCKTTLHLTKQVCISQISRYCSRYWPVGCSGPSQYLNKC